MSGSSDVALVILSRNVILANTAPMLISKLDPGHCPTPRVRVTMITVGLIIASITAKIKSLTIFLSSPVRISYSLHFLLLTILFIKVSYQSYSFKVFMF